VGYDFRVLNGEPTKRIVRASTIEHDPFTYGKQDLNLGKTGDSYKTNPSQLHRVGPPALTTRTTEGQTDETNHTCLNNCITALFAYVPGTMKERGH
jgi:hypothetical protein